MLYLTILPMTLALILDGILGDPIWFPHPVKGFGRLIQWVEDRIYRPSDEPSIQKMKGTVLLFTLMLAAALPTVLVLALTGGLARFLVMTSLFWLTLSMRTMGKEASLVARRLEHGTMEEARGQVGRIVGRDTAGLSREDIARACVESVAESTSDGIIAPMFWGFILGPVGAMVYKAINTLDSMVGYKNEKYLWFGGPSAKADDLANWIPARLTGIMTVLVAWTAGGSPLKALRVYLRDHANHASPNSGHPEAAFAGALNIELGGPSSYGGHMEEKPFINKGARLARQENIAKSVRLMRMTVLAFLLAAILIAWLTGGSIWTGLN